MSWLRRPVIHFIALGGLLFVAKQFAALEASPAADGDASGLAVITRERIAELRQDWLARTGLPPNERALDALIQQEIDDTVLVLEARERGLHLSDPVVQRRLLRNMQFLNAEPERSDEELLDEAYALGFDRTDLVVRRRLAQMLTLEVLAGAREEPPQEAELSRYLAEHPDRFTQPERMRISHVFLSRDSRGEALADDARALLAELATAGSDAAVGAGDPFLFPRDLPSRSERDLAKTFGPEFAAQVRTLPVGRWSGPVASAYGLHLVWVHERTPAARSDLEVVRSEVREAVFHERAERALRERLRELRERHPVRVEPRSGPVGAE